jgi:hypothetical protein
MIMKKYRILVLAIIFLVSGCTATKTTLTPDNRYEDWLSTCKDYKDVVKWMDNHFSYNMLKNYDCFSRDDGTLCEATSPQMTFQKKSGVCFDAAIFAKVSLNRINPDYRAEIVFILPQDITGTHYVTGFYMGGKLFILDYGVPFHAKQRGTWGPFKNLDEYIQVYLTKTTRGNIKTYHFGWPNYRKFEVW